MCVGLEVVCWSFQPALWCSPDECFLHMVSVGQNALQDVFSSVAGSEFYRLHPKVVLQLATAQTRGDVASWTSLGVQLGNVARLYHCL